MKNDTHTNDNFNPWQSIGWQANLILNKLRIRLRLDEEKNEQPESKPDTNAADKEREEHQRRYIEQRLRELAIWERRVSGK